jgi:hypothetical protein
MSTQQIFIALHCADYEDLWIKRTEAHREAALNSPFRLQCHLYTAILSLNRHHYQRAVPCTLYAVPDLGSPSFCMFELESFQVMLRGPSLSPPPLAPPESAPEGSLSIVPSAQA